VEVFTCQTTFERELTLPGTLGMLEAGTREIGAPRLANTLGQLREQVAAGQQPDLTAAKDRVLRAAKRFGKARYAQMISKHASTATAVPQYLRLALEWLIADAANG
jgi:putative ATP-dependent endonuclease of the OLD family